eukprot:jgi/Chlat1/7394/Chrsp6S00592
MARAGKPVHWVLLVVLLAAAAGAARAGLPLVGGLVGGGGGGGGNCNDEEQSGSWWCRWGSTLVGAPATDFFPDIPIIPYEGPKSKNPLAFKWFNAEEFVLGKPMKEWLKFSVAFWHTFRGDGSDMFGSPTKQWPWEDPVDDPLHAAFKRMRANFELMHKLGVDRWCFHDRDIAPVGKDLAETEFNLDQVVLLAKELQENTTIRPLWGTAQLFKHPRYMHGAATSPSVNVFAFAAAQVKKCMEITHELGGENFVFWGGREGYSSLLNTDLQKELDHMALFLRLALDYKNKIGFKGTLLLEPKPQEPTKHQYDWDAATTIAFLQRGNFTDEDFKLNIECNHAQLAGHSCEHELEVARVHGVLGNVDANTGDAQTGWDTDEFLTDPRQAALVMLPVVRQGGLGTGGFNFDAKLRRESTDVEDIFLAHISGMDALARGLRIVASLKADGRLDRLVDDRYDSWETQLGKAIEAGEMDFDALAKVALQNPEPTVTSGRQELAEMYLSMSLS